MKAIGLALASYRPRSAGRHAVTAAGFTLFEVLLALLLMALLAGLALPTPHRPAGPMTLRMAAYRVLTLLREARSAATNGSRPIEATVDRAGIAVEAGGRRLLLPDGVAAALADRSTGAIRFGSDGTSTGGTVVLQTASNRIAIAVENGTGAVHLVP